MNNWKPYIGDRLKFDHPAGFVVIIPNEHEKAIPLSCPICRLLMRSADDAGYYRTKQCCQKCGMKWADHDLQRWNDGWRPDEKEIKVEVDNRQSTPISLNLDMLDT